MGGFAGGQAEYVRVPFGDVNLLKLPDNVPDEKGTPHPPPFHPLPKPSS